jgi:ribonuclease VapC
VKKRDANSRTEYIFDSSGRIALVSWNLAVRSLLAELDLRVEDWSEDLAFRSAEFSPFNKSHGLSLGDRACLTLAKQLRATAVTSDRAWKRLPSLGVSVMLFR